MARNSRDRSRQGGYSLRKSQLHAVKGVRKTEIQPPDVRRTCQCNGSWLYREGALMSFGEQVELLTSIYDCDETESRSFLVGLANGLLFTAVMASLVYWAVQWCKAI